MPNSVPNVTLRLFADDTITFFDGHDLKINCTCFAMNLDVIGFWQIKYSLLIIKCPVRFITLNKLSEDEATLSVNNIITLSLVSYYK